MIRTNMMVAAAALLLGTTSAMAQTTATPPTTPPTPPATGAPATPAASAAVPATQADITVGATVNDSAGVAIGTVDSVDASGAVVKSGDQLVKLPIASFGKSSTGLSIAVTKAGFDEAVAKSKAAAPAPAASPAPAATPAPTASPAPAPKK